MTKFWLTMPKFCLASIVISVIGVADTAAVAGAGATDNGAVYTMTNSSTANAVVAYERAADGTLTMSGIFPTGGKGIDFFATGNQDGVIMGNHDHCLWAVNSGSNQISAFEVKGTSLSLTKVIDSGGQRPISLTVNEDLGVLYVLNAGGQVGPQYSDNITGFTLREDCRLKPLAGSTRALSGSNVSPAQVGFNPSGSVVVVTEKTSESVFGQLAVSGGNITTFIVRGDGRLSSGKSFAKPCGPSNTACPATEPFGFAFDNRGQLLVTAADCTQPRPPGPVPPGCTVPPDHPSLLSYKLAYDGTLKLVKRVVDDQAAKCWIVITDSQRSDDYWSWQKNHDGLKEFAFTVNALATQAGGTPGSPPAGSITGYKVSHGGIPTELGVTPIPINLPATPVGVPVDAALSRNSRFLYVLSEGDGSISAYEVGSDGGLTLLNTYAVTTPPAIATGGPFPNGLAAR